MMRLRGWHRTGPRRLLLCSYAAGLSPAAVSRAEAVSGPTPYAASSAGLARAQSPRICLSTCVISVSRFLYRRARCRSARLAYAAVVCAVAGRRRAQTSIWARVESPRSRCLTCSGAVTTRAWIWLAAWVRALIPERRTTRSILVASTGLSPPLGRAVASPLRAARAAASASVVSSLPRRRRSWRLGRFTSTTPIPASVR